MNFTGKRVIQKIVALLLVMIMTLADFSIIGANVISYALDMVATNSDNVEFFAYFINENKEKTSIIESEINAKDLKMYVEVAVKNEGYFNGEITLGDSSFSFVENTSNEYVKQIKDNTVTLNQINAGVTAKIELNVEFNNSNEIIRTSLNQENIVNLTGNYTSSKKDVKIKGETKVQVNWKSPKDIGANLDTKILTNSIYKIKDVEKRVVQVLVDSKLNNNSYPVKETKIELNIPKGAEAVNVNSRSTDATNNVQRRYSYNYELDTDDPNVTITIKNEEDNGKINWNKDAKDIFVVTYEYPKNTYFNHEKVNSNVTITTYDDKQVKEESQALISENIDGIITNEIIEKESEIYKGKIYTGEKRNYISTTVLNIDYFEIAEKIQLVEEEAKFKTENGEKNANIQFTKTKINKVEFLGLFGQEGYIKILDLKGNVLQTINNLSETDNEGNVVVEYANNEKVVVIETSKPRLNGILNIVHTKSILEDTLSRNEIRELVEIKEQVNSSITKNDGNNFKNIVTNTIKLKETSSDANIKISKEKLSTITENQDVEIVATLETNGENKDLYKNPTVKIIFPREILEVNITQAKALYRNGLNVERTKQTKIDGNIVLTIEFQGEQSKYDSDILNGLELHFYANILVDKSISSHDVALMMQYTNENGSKDVYDAKTKIYLESQYGLMLYNKVENFNTKGEIIETIDEDKKEARLNVNNENITAKVTTSLINNYSKDLGNIEIIGKIPSKEEENKFNSTIKDLNVSDNSAKIYYNKNINAKTNDNDWTNDSKDAKVYKVVLDKIESGKVVKIQYNLEIEDNLSYNMTGDLITNVVYTNGENEITKASNIVLATEEAIIDEPTGGEEVKTDSKLELSISATSGNRKLNNSDSIYNGETIRYTINIKNNTGKDCKDLNIKAIQTNGKIFDLVGIEVINPILYGVDGRGIENYWEITDSNIKEFKDIAIKNGDTVTVEYQVVADKTEGDEIYADISITSSDSSIKESIITDKYKINDSELKLNFVPAVSEECTWVTDSIQQSNLSITNVSGKDLENIEVKITLSKELSCDKYKNYITWSSDIKAELKNKEINSLGQTIVTLKIEQIISGKTAEIYVSPYILEFNGEKTNVELYARATTLSNKTYTSNNIIREVTQVKKQIEIDQVIKINDTTVTKNSVANNGDKVDFYITLKNSDKENAKLSIYNYIQSGLNVKNITLVKSDRTKVDITDKYSNQRFAHELQLVPGEEINIRISTILDALYMNGQKKITNKVDVTDNNTTAVYTSTVEFNVNIPKIDDGKLNIELKQTSNLSNNTTVKTGDKIEFIATIKNTGDFDRKVNIYDYLNTSIKNITVLIDNKDITEKHLVENDLEIKDFTVKANTTNTIKILGTIDLTNYTEKTIFNEFILKSSIADMKSNSIEYYVSQENKDEDKQEQEIPSIEIKNYTISGKAWIDSDKDGKRDDNEELVKDMTVRAINTETKEVLTTSAITKEDGSYELELPQANYIIIFMYDNENYYITTYQAKKVSGDVNSDAVSKTLNIDNQDVTVGSTDIIDLSENKENIDIGLVFRYKFDLKLEKYVKKIVVTNNEGTITYNFDNEELAKVEIASKYLSGSKVVVEYEIKVTNVGDIDGYVKNIVDYMPADMNFSSDLNKDWYLSGKNLYNESIADKKLEPGKSHKVDLILTKTMTESNIGLVNNTAAIKSAYNEKSFSDSNKENNNGLADIIISVKTGAVVQLVSLTLSMTIVIAGVAYFITRRYIN